MKRSSGLVVLSWVVLLACGGGGEDDAPPAAEGLPLLPALSGCRAYLSGTLLQQPFFVPAPTVTRSDGAAPLPGAWTETATTRSFVSTDWVNVPCGAPSASVEFSALQGVGRLSSRIRVEVPSSSGGSPDVLHLWPEPPVIDRPDLGPTLPLTSSGAYPATLTPTDGVADICDTSQTTFPLGTVSLPGSAGPPAGAYQVEVASTLFRWEPTTWTNPAAPMVLEDAEATLVCDSTWALAGGYQLTFQHEVEGVVKAEAQHDFWFEGELGLVDDTQVLGYYRLYDIAVRTDGNVTGSYAGPTEVLIPVEGFYEKSVDGKAYVDLPAFAASGITWQFTLDVLGTRISQQNANILQDHLDRLNLTFPPSPSRPGYIRLLAAGQEDTVSNDRDEGFLIANWGFRRREAGTK